MMLSVPSVTMNGGICIRVTSAPLSQPHKSPQMRPSGKAIRTGTPSTTAEASHNDRRNDHDDADRKIDAGGQDDKRLRDAEDADDRDLGQHGREIAGR